MREIKFRAWDGHLMLYPGKDIYGFMTYDGLPIFISMSGIPQGMPYLLMQYTGLKDKNGKEMYEGDIVRYFRDSLATIEWLKGGFRILGSYRTDDFHGLGGAIEVVGNIYENPRLLGKKDE